MTEGTDMNQIEKVARAICAANGCDPDTNHEGSPIWVDWVDDAKAAIAAMPVQAEPVATRWQLGDKVKKKANSSWRGVVCGFYNTAATPNGYSVVSLYEPGSVQVWPEAALEDWDGVMVEDELRAEITRLAEALREAEEREKALREERDELLSQISDCRGSHWLGRQDRKGVTPHLDAIWRGLVEVDDARQTLAGAKPC